MKSTRKILSLMLSLALVCVTPIHGFATSIPPSESQAEIVERLREHVIKYHSDLAPEEQEDLVLELYEENMQCLHKGKRHFPQMIPLKMKLMTE